MHRIKFAICLGVLLFNSLPKGLGGQEIKKDELIEYRRAGQSGGNPAQGKTLFESDKVGCTKCHVVQGDERRAGPGLWFIGDKFGREQLVESVLEPSATIHPDYGTVVATTTDGKLYTGVLRKRTDQELQLLDSQGKLVRLPVTELADERRTATSLMPADLHKTLKPEQFADLIAYLESLKQPQGESRLPGMPSEIPSVEKPIALVPLNKKAMRFDHPVWITAIPGSKSAFLVVEQQTRRLWRFDTADSDHPKELFADFSSESTTGEFEGVACVAFHPRFVENRKYYVNYHVRKQGSFFSPVYVERQATSDLRRDAGLPSRRVLQIHQDTDLHWGGMLAFGPDGYLYLGPGDAGPQEDPEGHGQDLNRLTGKILRIDVDHQEGGKAYAIPESNPYRSAGPSARPEVWASGLRNPWRFSFDSLTQELWVGDVGQYLFEKVSIVRPGENQGWNVFEGFLEFSNQYRRPGAKYTPPVFAYRRKHGVSVTGGYVYRGKRNLSYYGTYIFGDYESKRIWALTQAKGQLIRVRQIGASPERIASFGVDADGELLLVGYEGTIFRLVLDGSDFGADPQRKARVTLVRGSAPTAARVSIKGGDNKPHAPAGAAIRKTKRRLAPSNRPLWWIADDHDELQHYWAGLGFDGHGKYDKDRWYGIPHYFRCDWSIRVTVVHRTGARVDYPIGSEPPEYRLAVASYDDDLEAVRDVLATYPTVDLDAAVLHSRLRGNGTPLVLTGSDEIARLLIAGGAAVNHCYYNGREFITPLDSAERELSNHRVRADPERTDRAIALIRYLESVGGKKATIVRPVHEA